MSAAPGTHRPQASRRAAPRRSRPRLWLALSTMILLALLSLLSAFWRLPTRVQLDVTTARLAFTLGGEESREILNRSVSFSSLVLEGCGTVVFAAEKLEVADPQQLVPGTEAGAGPSFPAAAWHELSPTGPVRFLCRDPAAKLTLQNPDPAAGRLGVLDRIRFASGAQVVLEVSPGREPALSLEMETSQELSLALGPELEIVADFVQPEGIAVPFSADLLTYRARLPEARRTLDVTSGDQGVVLILTPSRGQLSELFREPLDLPLAAVEMLEENLEGTLTSPLRDKAVLSYPDYPSVQIVTIEADEAVGLGGLSQARLRSLELDAEKQALRARFDAITERATRWEGSVSDRRLTLLQVFRHSGRWTEIAAAAVSLFSVAWSAFEIWKRLQE